MGHLAQIGKIFPALYISVLNVQVFIGHRVYSWQMTMYSSIIQL